MGGLEEILLPLADCQASAESLGYFTEQHLHPLCTLALKLGLQHLSTYRSEDASFQPDGTRALHRRQSTADSRNHAWRCQSWCLTLLKPPHKEKHVKADVIIFC